VLSRYQIKKITTTLLK